MKYLLLATFVYLGVASTTVAENGFGQIDGILKLAKGASQEKSTCDSFMKSLEDLDSSSQDYFATKKIALQVLAKAKDYPGTPLSTEKTLNSLLYVDQSDLPGGALAGDLRSTIARLSDCRSVEYYGILNRLIKSRKRYHFTEDESTELKALLTNYLIHESSGPRFLYQVRMLIRLLDLSVKEMLILPSPDQRIQIENLSQLLNQSEANEGKHLSQFEAGMSKLADAKNINELNVNRSALIQTLWQLQESQRLRLPLTDILRSIKNGPSNPQDSQDSKDQS